MTQPMVSVDLFLMHQYVGDGNMCVCVCALVFDSKPTCILNYKEHVLTVF